jgi:hypothetical protein
MVRNPGYGAAIGWSTGLGGLPYAGAGAAGCLALGDAKQSATLPFYGNPLRYEFHQRNLEKRLDFSVV